MDKPFVSFIVMTYNAEKYVKEAIEGAFAQTYENMEIIISDDCSTDNTFAIIEEAVKAYSGIKTVRVIRNEKNLGIGAHLNKLWWEEAKGDWIIPSAGDDVSLPGRTETMMNEAYSGVSLIHGNHYSINEFGDDINRKSNYFERYHVLKKNSVEDVIVSGICVIGCCMAINKKMLEFYGPFVNNIVSEDIVLAYRSIGFGKIVFVNSQLVKYRIHSASISFTSANYVEFTTWKDKRDDLYKRSKWNNALLEQILIDLRTLSIDNLRFLEYKTMKTSVDWYLYGDGDFKFSFLKHIYFYKQNLKYILYPLKYLLSNKF